MRRRSLVELARISELVWSWRLARWVEREREDRRQVEEALASGGPRCAQALAVWETFAEQRQERLRELKQALASSVRGLSATRKRLGIARARRRAAARAMSRRGAAAAAARAVELEAWLVRKAAMATDGE